ncbi:hypothetical protein HGRIS_007925 [Hohenbuehelia grisea]|uniref:MYND-type domain-containing protein n=1 Tax=Hohenbuehelia grisea TaxID=104357 RepID=A0ABR3J6R9_9AGAR
MEPFGFCSPVFFRLPPCQVGVKPTSDIAVVRSAAINEMLVGVGALLSLWINHTLGIASWNGFRSPSRIDASVSNSQSWSFTLVTAAAFLGLASGRICIQGVSYFDHLIYNVVHAPWTAFPVFFKVILMHSNRTRTQPRRTMDAETLAFQALQASHTGRFAEAEQLYRHAIRMKEQSGGSWSLDVARIRHSLGELYMRFGHLESAKESYKRAISVRNYSGPAFDAAVSREGLAQVYEVQGHTRKAREVRLSGSPNRIACGHYYCNGLLFDTSTLSVCGGCKSIFYCSKGCQSKDWKLRHHKCCKPSRS